MLLRTIYDESLAQAAYLIGCQRTGEALVIDPARDADQYIALAADHGLRLAMALETHIHADFLSGVRELCARDVSIEAVLPGEGGPAWTHTWPARDGANHRFVKDGDEVRMGGITLRVLHTPGHTPEHVSYLVHDEGSGAEIPIGIATGDFVFVGDLGRPDLLETAAGHAGTMEDGARQLAASSTKFHAMPAHLQVWPGHGSGSACGKALGAVPASTVGYELRTNAALRLASDTDAFVREILSGQPEPPAYFGRMKTLNRDGAPILGALPAPERCAPAALADSCVILDTRPWAEFRDGHLPCAISAPLDKTFPTIAGSYVDPEREVALVVDEDRCPEAVRLLVRVGIDRVPYRLDPAYSTGSERTPEVTVHEASALLESGAAVALDVRRLVEHDAGCVPGSVNVSHVRLIPRLDEVPKDQPLMVSCRSGVRSARAASLLRALGYDATNVAGGFIAWEEAGLPVERPEGAHA